VYAPALVAFVGGSNWGVSIGSGGPPIGWFPLGPRDVYVPWYQVSRGYFGRVNVHNTVVVNNVYVTNIYNDYYVQGRPMRRDYTFRNAGNAVTVVPRDTFVSARNAAQSMARLRPGALAQGELMMRAPASPTRASLADASGRLSTAPSRATGREVIARNQPAARTAAFDVRQRAIERNGGEPLATDQMRRLDASNAAGRSRSDVRLIGRDSSSPAGRTAARPEARDPAGARSSRGVVTREVGGQPAPVVAGDRGRGAATGTRPSAASGRGAAPSARESTPSAVRQAPATRTQSTTGNPAGSRSAVRGNQQALPSARYSPQRGARQERSTSPASEGIPLPPRRSAAPERSVDRAPARASSREADSANAVRGRTAAPVGRGDAGGSSQRQPAPARTIDREPVPARPVQQREPAQREQRISAPRDTRPQHPSPASPPQRSAPAPVREAPVQREAPAAREAAPERERAAPAERSARSTSRGSARERER